MGFKTAVSAWYRLKNESEMIPKLVSTILFAIWLVLVVLGKGGFIHLVLLAALFVLLVDRMAAYRARIIVTNADKL